MSESKILLIVGLFIGLIILFTVLIAAAWGWVVPDVFSEMVKRGTLPASLTLWQAFKLGCLLAVLGLTQSGSKSK